MQTVRERGEVDLPLTTAEQQMKWQQDARQYAKTALQAKSDPVKRPAHYTKGDIEVIDFIDQTVDGYADPRLAHYVACALKYLARAPHKGKMQEDLAKAEWYITRAVNRAATLAK